jgi:phospholipid transport system substrate-binding protein
VANGALPSVHGKIISTRHVSSIVEEIMKRRLFLHLNASLLAAVLFPLGPMRSASALATPSPTPRTPEERFIHSLHTSLRNAIKKSADPKKDPKLLEIFEGALDYEYLSTASLGKHQLEAEQRAEFDDVFRRLVRASYRKNLRDPSSYEVSYEGTSDLDQDAKLVKTTTHNKKNKREKPLDIDYRLTKKGGTYLIQDVVTGGVSLVDNYRRQFGRVIRKKGFPKLMELMHDRLRELEGRG